MKKFNLNFDISQKNLASFLTVLGFGTVSYVLYKTFTSSNKKRAPDVRDSEGK